MKLKKKTMFYILIGAFILVTIVLFGMSRGVFLRKGDKVLLATKNTLDDCIILDQYKRLPLGSEKGFTMLLNGNIQKKDTSYLIDLDYESDEVKTKYLGGVVEHNDRKTKFQTYLDDNRLVFTFPDLSPDVYSYSYIGEKSGDITKIISADKIEELDDICKNLSANADTDIEKKNESEEKEILTKFRKRAFTACEDETFLVDGKDMNCKGYSTTVSKEEMEEIRGYLFNNSVYDREELISNYSKLTGKDYESMDPIFLAKKNLNNIENCKVNFYIAKNHLAAVRLETDGADILQVEFQGLDKENEQQIIKYTQKTQNEETLTGIIASTENASQINFMGINASLNANMKDNKNKKETNFEIEEFTLGNRGFSGTISIKEGQSLQIPAQADYDIGEASFQEFWDIAQKMGEKMKEYLMNQLLQKMHLQI